MNVVAIRGANTVDTNDEELIKIASVEMVKKIVDENQINKDDIVMVFLTMTSDLTAYNAAAAIRVGMAWNDVPFFTSQEPNIDGMLPKCVRVLIQYKTYKSKTEIKHIYLGKASSLRPDLKES